MAYALHSVARRPGRSAITAIGIGLATALVVMLLAVSEGVEHSSATLAEASGVDLLVTSANTSLAGGSFPPVDHAHGLPAALRTADPNVAAASPWLIASLTFANDSLRARSAADPSGADVPSGWAPTGSGIVGWVPSYNIGLSTPNVLAGPGFSDPGDPHYANGTYAGPATHAIVLDQALSTVLRAGVGAVIWVAPTAPAGPADLAAWFGSATNFTVVGISEPFWLIPSALLAFTYLSELQAITGDASAGQDPASLVLVHLADGSDPSADQARLESALPGISVFTLGNILGAVQSAIDLYKTFGSLIGAIALIVATLFTTTVLLMSVDDRSREIAVLRAIGVARPVIVRYVVEEALVLAFLGFAVGFPLGVAGAIGLDRFLAGLVVGLPSGFRFVAIDATVSALALTEVIAIGLIAAILPAARAATLPVVQELRAP